MTQEDLAQAAGVALGTIKNIESEKRITQEAKLAPVLAVLGLDRKHTEHWTDDQWFVAETAVAFFDQVPIARQPQAAGRLVDLLTEMLLPMAATIAASDDDLAKKRAQREATPDRKAAPRAARKGKQDIANTDTEPS